MRPGITHGATHIQVSFTQTSTGATVVDEGTLELDGNLRSAARSSAAAGTTLTFAGPLSQLRCLLEPHQRGDRGPGEHAHRQPVPMT